MYTPIMQPKCFQSVKLRRDSRILLSPETAISSPEFGDTGFAKVKVETEGTYRVATITGLEALGPQSDAEPPSGTGSVTDSNHRLHVLAEMCTVAPCVALVAGNVAADHSDAVNAYLSGTTRLPLAFDEVDSLFWGVEIERPTLLIDQLHARQLLEQSEGLGGCDGIVLLAHPKSSDMDAATVVTDLTWITTLEVVEMPDPNYDDFHQRFLEGLLNH